MITKNDKKFALTLKAVNADSKINELIIKEQGVFTLISEEKTMYLYFDSKCECLRKLEKYLCTFIGINKYDINIDVESFLNIYKSKKIEAFRTLIEVASFAGHNKFEMKLKPKTNKSYNFIYNSTKELDDMWNSSTIKMEFVNFARDLQDLPPNVGTSVEIAKRISDKAKTVEGIKVTVLDKKQIEAMDMGLLLAVNAGSHVDPRVVILEYVGDAKKPKTVLVGKGISFDSGGYNLKPSNFMKGMKFDMSGAAIMSSTIMALAKSKAKCNVASVAMLTDNRIGGHATLTESIIKSMNGMTVQIDNTDAEGRLVLADGITYAVRNLKADRIIDAATLTGAIVVALGKWHTGVFTKTDAMWNELEKASLNSLERVWRQPLLKEHLQAMQKTPIADLTNAEPSREAGSSTAAAFLDIFAEKKEFMHLDIAGTAEANNRGKAVMLRTLFEMLK